MEVSVIVPNFNHGKFLGERLESIFNQSFRDFEVIVLDDCSTDGSRKVIESYRSRPELSHIVYNESNSGSPFKQWKKGFGLARGRFVWIAESDDFCESGLLGELIAPMLTDDACVMSFCGSDKVDVRGVSSGLHENLAGLAGGICDGRDFIMSNMKKNVVVNASSVLFRKDAALLVDNGYDSLGGYGDYMFWVGLMEQGRVAYNPRILNHFRFHETNTTASVRSSLKGARETIVTDAFLARKGIISKANYRSRTLSSAYRLRYGFAEHSAQWREVWDMLPEKGFGLEAALVAKRLKRLVFNR